MNKENSVYINSPKGKERLKWLGPAFIWMLAAAGSGEVLFTPRIASQYGYALIWALFLAVSMKWFINREIGRYTVCTGATFFQGLASLKNKRWLLWLIIVPQVFVAIVTIAGLSGAASTAIIVLIDIPVWIPGVVIILLCAAIIATGKFTTIEKITTVLAILISVSVLAAAISVGPDFKKIGAGFVPTLPENTKMDEVLPWLGFILAGAAGMMWFSYWIAARGYGLASLHRNEPINANELPEEQKKDLKSWLNQMTIVNTLAVVGAFIIAIAFLILGSELLKPEGLLPEENKVASVLGKLFGSIWGQLGFWYMVIAVFVIFVSTILSDQDGFGRMFADGTAILANAKKPGTKWGDPHYLKKMFVWVILAILPIAVYLVAGEPVMLLKLGGIIEASHIPVVAGLILYLNKKTLPVFLQPSWFVFSITLIAGVFFAVFAIIHILQVGGVL